MQSSSPSKSHLYKESTSLLVNWRSSKITTMNYFVLTLNSDKWIKFNITLVFNGLLTFFTWLKYERALSVAPSCSSKERFLTDFFTKDFFRFFVGFSCTSSLKVTLASCPMYLYILLAEMIKTGNDVFLMTMKKTMVIVLVTWGPQKKFQTWQWSCKAPCSRNTLAQRS